MTKNLFSIKSACRPTVFSLSVLLCLLINTAALAAGEETGSAQEQIKVAFVYNFTKYFSWPETAKSQGKAFNICLTDQTQMDGVFSSLSGEATQGKAINLHLLNTRDAVAVEALCHVLFLPADQFDSYDSLISDLESHDVLVVSDAVGSADKGSVIELVKVANKIKFKINQDSVEEKGLNVSALLLRLSLQ